MKIIAVMPVYNCDDVVLRALESIDDKVDEIRCYDGRWIGHNGADHSIDNTEQVILKFAEHSQSKVFYKKLEPAYEWAFHNEILKDIVDNDWIFKLDSDEIILEWLNVRETLDNSTEKAYRVCWGMFKTYAAVPNAKFYRKTPTLY
jgi:glycosyltransferase involved in cell wall biosynthesis